MKVAVIGAGAMGSGIAQTFAQCDAVEKVYLCDIKQEFADGGLNKIKKGLDRLDGKGKEFIISTKIIMSLLTLDDEISAFLINTMKSFNVYEKMEVFEALIDDCKDNIWVELNSTVGFLYMNNANADEMSIEDRTKLILERERNDPNYFSPILITGKKSQGS